MFDFFKKPRKPAGDSAPLVRAEPTEEALRVSLEENVSARRRLFEDVDILRVKYVDNVYNKALKYCILYCDGVVNSALINDSVIKPLILSQTELGEGDLLDTVMKQVVQANEIEKTSDVRTLVEAISYGDTVLFADGQAGALVINTKYFQTRSIAEPDNEKNLSGPREGFNESIMTNLSLVRRKVLSADMKLRFMSFGQRTRTKACICYMDSLVDKKVLAELCRRLESIDMDAVLDTNYISELIKDNPWSPFRTTGDTERPDTVVAKIMEGRIAIFLDGSPMVLTVPYLFIENFQSSEDYYLNFFYSTFSRWLRIFGFLLTISVPGLYIAVGAFHHEMFPFHLFVNIAAERSSVPLPAAVEAFLMIILFDILREAGARMPSNVGQAMSIVGALVIGQAAVEAKLVAAPMIIVVALTGITSMLVPRLNAPAVYIRLTLLVLSSSFGFFGFILGMSILLMHIINLRSLGVPEVRLTGELRRQEMKDTVIRAPWWNMILRPTFAANRVRMHSREVSDEEQG